MPNNLPNVSIPQNQWTNLYAALGVSVGTLLTIENVGDADVYLAVQAAQPTPDHNSYTVVKRPPSVAVQNTAGDAGAWAYCNGSGGKLAISTGSREGFLPVASSRLLDAYGNPIGSLRGAIDVHLADVHYATVNDFVHRHVTPATTLAAPAAAGAIQIAVTSAVGFTVGSLVHLGTVPGGSGEPVHPEVTAIAGTLLTLDRPLDNGYAAGTVVAVAIVALQSAVGTLAAPIAYRYWPVAGRIEHILRLMVQMTHSTAADDSAFGNLPRLTNGVVLRARISGVVGTLTNWKANGDMRLDMFDVIYTDKAGPSTFGVSARGAFSDIGVVLRLDAAQGDYFEILIQDNLTALTSFKIKMQGHVEG